MAETITSENTPLEFPCDFPIKAMIRTSDDSREAVLTVVETHVEIHRGQDVRSRPSRNGRFESLTISVRVDSRDQLERIYADIRALDAVLMML